MPLTIRVVSASGATSTVPVPDPTVSAGVTVAAPKCLVAAPGPGGSIVLGWDEVAWPAGSTNRVYEVHEDLIMGTDRILGTVSVATRTSGPANGTYRYYVRAKCSAGASAASPKITVTAPVTAVVRSPAGCVLVTEPPPPPPPAPGIPALWNASPPPGMCPAPAGPIVGTDSFDRALLAVTGVWDHFDGVAGSIPDGRLWLRDTQSQGGTQTYDPAHAFLDGNSHAVLEATRASNGAVTSGRFTSRTKWNVQYGWHAARVKFPSFVGQFPAVWMLYVGYNTNKTNYGEIDMMEYFGPATKYSTHLHFGGGAIPSISSDKAVPAGHSGGNAANDFHTYWMLWEPNKIQIGVDDLSMGTWPPPNADSWGHMNQPFYWIFNLAVGPAGDPADPFIPRPDAAAFPARMLIDWVWSVPLDVL